MLSLGPWVPVFILGPFYIESDEYSAVMSISHKVVMWRRVAQLGHASARRCFTICSKLDIVTVMTCTTVLCPYMKACCLVRSLGMEPLATLHHFVHPQWFEKLGAFEREENIALFLAWTRLAFQCAHDLPGLGGVRSAALYLLMLTLLNPYLMA